jgi:hypothetical protein
MCHLAVLRQAVVGLRRLGVWPRLAGSDPNLAEPGTDLSIGAQIV